MYLGQTDPETELFIDLLRTEESQQRKTTENVYAYSLKCIS